jgi:hypothetical protein
MATLSPDVRARRFAIGAELMHVTSLRVFELNETAARIWERVSAGVSLEEIARDLASAFEVDVPEAELEVNRLFEEFRREGFVVA